MPKLTKKTTKEGQKCVLTIKSDIYCDYMEVRYNQVKDISELLNQPNLVYRTDYDATFSVELEHEKNIIYSHISNVMLKNMKRDCKESNTKCGFGELSPKFYLDKGTEIEIIKYCNWANQIKDSMKFANVDFDDQILAKVISGEHKDKYFTANTKAILGRLDTAHFEDLSQVQNAKPKYKIFYDGKVYKNKIFGDLGKVKASIMNEIGYLEKVNQLNQHYKEMSPEVGGSASYWLEGQQVWNRNDMKKVQIFEWANRKKGKESDFDALAHYDGLMDFVKVTAQYGSAVREQYKKFKTTGEFSTIVCFMHEDYRLPEKDTNGNYNYCDYEYLKESQIIKDAMKLSKLKGTKKCTKNGKTAICFKSESDAMKLLRNLEKGTYFVLDMNGNQLIEQSTHFIQNVARMKKLERILIEEFENDFEFETETK